MGKQGNYKTSIVVVFFILVMTMVFVYVTGGVLYAYNPFLIYSKLVLALLFCSSLTISILLLHVGYKKYDLSEKLKTVTSSDFLKEKWEQFKDRYNLSKIDAYLLAVMIIIGGVARIVGFNWGKVASWQADERKLTDAPINMINFRTPYPDNVYYPNQFVSKIVSVIVFIMKQIMGVSIEVNRSVWVIFVFRVVVAICGILTIYVAFLIGNYISKHLGCVFAMLVAIYPYYINLAKQVTGDVTALLFLSILMLFSLRYMDEKRNIHLMIMCACAAMGTLEKWHGAVGIGFIGVFLLFCCSGIKEYVEKGIMALGMYLIWLLILAPNVVANPAKTIRDGFINIAVYDGSDGAPYLVRFVSYFRNCYNSIFGVFGLIFVALGLVYIVFGFNRKYIVFILGILKIMCLGFLNRGFPRWGFEFYFSVLFVISLGIYNSLLLLSRTDKALRWSLSVVVLSCALIMTGSFVAASYLTVLVSSANDRDTRLIQREECLKKGILPDDMTSQYYSGFAPAASCDSEFPDEKIVIDLDWSDYLVSDNGKMYRTEQQPDYICLCPSHYSGDKELNQILQNDSNVTKIFEYDAICKDTFFIPFLREDTSLNDLKLIKNNIALIRQIQNGGLIGEDIVVYDVSRLERQ